MKKALIVIAIILALFAAGCVYFASKYEPSSTTEWGITFSHRYAESLGYDWKVMYLDMLNDLKPKKLRLMAYWEDIEPQPNVYDFSKAALMLEEAGKRNIEVILVVGHKQPRWPECHHPDWYGSLSQEERDQAQLKMVENAVNYYKRFDAIKIWQVENEALFTFGHECPKTPVDLIQKEMEIVRKADSRPILMTDSGELGRWIPVIKLKPDLFGSTMYRVVHSPKLGYFKYPLPPYFFKVKAGVAETFGGPQAENIMGVELQAEPWFANGIDGTDIQTQYALMNPKIFREYVQYAKDVGFEENYLWGIEWWYWLAHKHNDWGMWEEARNVFAQ